MNLRVRRVTWPSDMFAVMGRGVVGCEGSARRVGVVVCWMEVADNSVGFAKLRT